MVKRCSYGLCNSDSRYPERLENGMQFVPFPKPKTNYEKCLRWIKLCGRPHSQLSTERINSNRYICTKHFVNQSWPTKEHPDPIPADLSTQESTLSPKRRRIYLRKTSKEETTSYTFNTKSELQEPSTETTCPATDHKEETLSKSQHSSCKTQYAWVNPLDLMSLSAENHKLKQDLAKVSAELDDTKIKLAEALKNQLVNESSFKFDKIQHNDELMQYYTGFSKDTFLAIFNFLVPDEGEWPIELAMNGSHTCDQIGSLSFKDQLLLTLSKLRLNLDFIDLGFRFGKSKKLTKTVFKYWINQMFGRFREVPGWLHRDTVSDNMPEDYKKEYPNTFAILDCFIIKTEKPSSAISQILSNQDSDTLKGILALDPKGSVIFASSLFSASMSDEDIFKISGFQEYLKKLVQIGFLHQGDRLLCDAGFNIEEAVKEIGLSLNTFPSTSSSEKINKENDVNECKIEKWNVNMENTIKKIKSFQIMSQEMPASLISDADQIWFVCAFVTNFMPSCTKLPD